MDWKLIGAAVLTLAVAGCGSKPEDRLSGGAATGAAVGAGVGALGGPVGALAGAAIGAGAGAVTGATTSPNQVNLGRPPWDNPQARVAGEPLSGGSSSSRSAAGDYGTHGSATVREAQQALNDRGFNAGQVDGIMGPHTASALREFQRQNNLTASGRLNQRTQEALNLSGSSAATGNAGAGSGGNANTGTGGPAPSATTGGSAGTGNDSQGNAGNGTQPGSAGTTGQPGTH